MTDSHAKQIVSILQEINTSLVQLVSIQQQRTPLENDMIRPTDVTTLINAYDALVASNANDATAFAAAKAEVASLTATIAEFNDPTLQAALDSALATAAAATPAVVFPPPESAVTPTPTDPNAPVASPTP